MRFIRSLLRAAPFVTTIATLVILQSCYAAIEENGFNQRSELRTSTFIKNDIEFQKNDIATDDNINIGPPIKNETENGIEVKDAGKVLFIIQFDSKDAVGCFRKKMFCKRDEKKKKLNFL